MQELDDISLLRQYTEHNSEEAFAALVSRHVNKVYSVALRHTQNPHQAEEITQAVFVILAGKARRLGKQVVLSGWLYQTARLTAMTFIRSEIRRTRREQEAHMQKLLDEKEADVWPQIAPLLDAAMSGLNETDRHAVVLRFFDGKSMREVGAALGASEGAAKMRLNRAVEKLRRCFTKRGVVFPAAVLTAAISANSVQAAPAVLAKTATAIALAKGATASASAATLIKGALKVMAWAKAKTAIVVGAAVLLATGAATTVAIKTVINKKMEALEAYQGQVWQQAYDTSVVDKVPPQVKIFPFLQSRPANINGWGERNGKMLGLGVGVSDIVQGAYGVSAGRLIFSSPVAIGRFDFISNLQEGQMEGLQEGVKKKFGLVGKRQLIETNVLVLTVRFRNAAGLRPALPTKASASRNGNSISCRDQPISKLVYYLENCLKIPVVDHTDLSGTFDFDLKWDSTSDGLKKVLLEQLGLSLVPGREAIEFVVVGKEK